MNKTAKKYLFILLGFISLIAFAIGMFYLLKYILGLMILAVWVGPIWLGGLILGIVDFFGPTLDEKQEEVLQDVEDIRQAELAYFEQNGKFLEVKTFPSYPSPMGYPWRKEDIGDFNKLSFNPEHDPRGSYSVILEGDGFKVIGTSDLDMDYTQATYTATKDSKAVLETEKGIY